MSRRVRPVPDGSRAPGCIVKGCANQTEPGALICRLQSAALRGSIRQEEK